MKQATVVLAALLVLASVAVAGGRATERRTVRVGLVAHPGIVATRRTYEGQVLLGFLEAERKLGVEGRIAYIAPTQDPSGALESLARQRYDLIVAAFPDPPAVAAVAKRFPHVRFLLIDASFKAYPRQARNVAGTVYRAEEAGYLAGYLGALMEDRRPGRHVISAVAGFPYSGVTRWTVGYAAGARHADPRIDVRTNYSYDFANAAKCRRLALHQIGEGSGVVFDVAGACGLGALSAAHEQHVWGVGVDIDQSYLGPHILTSAVINLDAGVFQSIDRFVHGKLAGGRDVVFDLQNRGVGLGRINARVPQTIRRRVDVVRRKIIAGTITVPRVS